MFKGERERDKKTFFLFIILVSPSSLTKNEYNKGDMLLLSRSGKGQSIQFVTHCGYKKGYAEEKGVSCFGQRRHY
jgi:hypothetical protein